MDKVSFADRLSLSYLLEADRKEDFYQIISELICEEDNWWDSCFESRRNRRSK